MQEKPLLLDVRGLSISFTQYGRRLSRQVLPVITDLNVQARAGEMVAIVGASGSGKSLLAHGILGLLPRNATMRGQIDYMGEPLTASRVRGLRGREIALVPQSVSYLDPLMKAGKQVRNGNRGPEAVALEKALLARYGLAEGTGKRYPFELSGGMTRRILIATALMDKPRLVIADEPTPGLHVDVAKRVLGHFREIADAGAGVLLITHDLALALAVADRIVVFYAGATIEEATARDFDSAETLRHPYTQALWAAMPQHGFAAPEGIQPYAGDAQEGCAYRPRCPQASAACAGKIPYRAERDGYVRCLYGGTRQGGQAPC